MRIGDSVAVVTGAAVGSGRAVATRLAEWGAQVVLADIDTARCAETRAIIEGRGGTATAVRTDLRDPDDVRALIEDTLDRFGRLDILVNNAGGGGHLPPHFPQADFVQWSGLLDLNLRGPMLATQLAGEAMGPDGGAIVNIASTAGLGYLVAPSPEYAAAKAGLIRFTTTLAGWAETDGVRVNCVVPDWLATDRAMAELAAMPAAERRATAAPIPLDDFCDAVVRLVEDDTLAGRVVVLPRGEPAYLIEPTGTPAA